ncbi:hypothetical protein [Peribacillus simplex]|uniref:hypothetical protein n=1 Tax=Peribacillus simplex TaxID=1478 RepID=UPI0028535F90|nr:hypothetical protein [Peribacillus simplex]MDR4926181.1 hypothetical protein [Peribacillus simplex]
MKNLIEKVDIAYYPTIEEIRILKQDFPNVVKESPSIIFYQPTNHNEQIKSLHFDSIIVTGAVSDLELLLSKHQDGCNGIPDVFSQK